ncbi:MAG: hypothetical protein Aurels2KO_47150 [Aureliella sp.]
MRRPSHDLPGCSQRIQRLTAQLHETVRETTEVWKDKRAVQFVREHIDDVQPAVNQVSVMVTKMTEEFERIAKSLDDPDRR